MFPSRGKRPAAGAGGGVKRAKKEASLVPGAVEGVKGDSVRFDEELDMFEKFFFSRYVTELSEKDVRHDGRSLQSSRDITVTPNIIKTAHGSSLVNVGGRTKVVCGVKGTWGPPLLASPNCGRIEVRCVIAPTAGETVLDDPHGTARQGDTVAEFVSSMIQGCGMVDLKGLCIEEGACAWVLHVDIYVLDNGGALRDACLHAAVSALIHTKLPAVEMVDGAPTTKGIVHNLAVAKYPIAVTLGYYNNHSFVDPTDKEETILASSTTVVFDSTSRLVSVYKPGGAPLGEKALREAIESARKQAKRIKGELEKKK